MSAFLGQQAGNMALTLQLGYGQNLDVLQEPSYSRNEPYTNIGRLQDVDILWPRSSFPQMFSEGSRISPENCMSQRWEWCWPPSGSHRRKMVSGTVIDGAGNPVSGATVNLFNTTTGLLVDTQTSASDGAFTCGDPNAVNCFIIAYLPGSPDTEGTTLNTLTGT